MSKMKLITTLIFSLIAFGFFGINKAQAATPVLNFSDLINGPASGLNDGLGEGTIITIWGNNIGSSQGSSTITIGGQPPAHIYYWKNADGNLPGGPSDLYTSHQMQEIAFSIPSSLTNGEHQIQVTANRKTSNTLPFTVRLGNIYHAMTSGSSSGDGSYGNPWGSFVQGGGVDGMVAGDVLYLHDDANDIVTSGMNSVSHKNGTEANQYGIVAYPNADCLIQAPDRALNFVSSSAHVLSKITFQAGQYDEPPPEDTDFLPETGNGGTGIGSRMTWGRIVGNKIQEIPGKCVAGRGGAIHPDNGGTTEDAISGLKVFGNYIYDWGCPQTPPKEHTTYFTIRNNGVSDVAPWEIGWNHLKDNKSMNGIHNYDEGDEPIWECGSPNGVVKIHDNYIINQRGPGIYLGNSSATTTCWDNGEFDVYNNVIIEAGKGTMHTSQNGLETAGVAFRGEGLASPIHFYNNKILASGDNDKGNAAAIYLPGSTNTQYIQLNISNNIVHDTRGGRYTLTNNSYTSGISGSDNTFYSTGGALNNTIDSRLTDSILNSEPQSVYFNTVSTPQLNSITIK